jgi:Tol biopolymer transport system component
MKAFRFFPLIALVLLIGVTLVMAARGVASPGTTERVSVDSAGNEGDRASGSPAISGDGRYVAFWSQASNLVTADTNGFADVFVRDRVTGAITRVSVHTSGAQGNDLSAYPAMSRDGWYIAFESQASNLVDGDTNGFQVSDIFLHDRHTAITELVSVSSSGIQGDSFSRDATISSDGRYVAFASGARNLADGDTNFRTDIFVRDLEAGTTERASMSSTGGQGNSDSAGPSLSSNGRYVAFYSLASNLADGDSNGVADVFVRDRVEATTTRVSVDSSGVQGNGESAYPAISGNGRYVAFWSRASDLVAGDTNRLTNIFVHDRLTATTAAVSVGVGGELGNDGSWAERALDISDDGRFIAFWSYASNLVPGDSNSRPDVFRRDQWAGTTELVSIPTTDGQGDNSSEAPAMSNDGRYVAFSSQANNLVSDDTNGVSDVFVHDRGELPEPTPTPSPTPPPAVGGIVEIRSGPSAPAAQQPGSAAPPYVALAGAAAAGALALTAAAWYARRRWLG